MQTVKKLLLTKQPLSDVRFNVKNEETNLIFIPESDSDIKNFLKLGQKIFFDQITIPGIITNFVGKKISSQKHYLDMKKEMPAYKYNRVPGDDKEGSANIFDMSGMTNEISKLLKSRSKKLVFNELIKLFNSVSKQRDTVLFIYNDSSSSVFLELIQYISLLSGNIKTDMTGIVYYFNGKYYPIGKPVTIKDTNYIKINKDVISLILKNIQRLDNGEDSHDEILTDDDISNNLKALRAEVNELTKSIGIDNDKKINMNKIKELVLNNEHLTGNFVERLKALYNEEKDTPIDELDQHTKDINRKYNGNIVVDIKSNDPVDPMKIVGMKELGNYNKQEKELNENMDENIKDLLESTLLADKDLNIEIKGIKTKIVDNFNDRYKEYIVKIQHKNIGNSTNRPYEIKFRVPIVVQGKYTRIGGNNYIMINQLFSSPISKVSPHLVRFYTHFSVTSVTLKSTHLSAERDFKDIESKFVQNLKSIKAIETTNFSNELKDEIIENYNIPDLESFQYQRIEIDI